MGVFVVIGYTAFYFINRLLCYFNVVLLLIEQLNCICLLQVLDQLGRIFFFYPYVICCRHNLLIKVTTFLSQAIRATCNVVLGYIDPNYTPIYRLLSHFSSLPYLCTS